jgi:hypothetical protein
MSIYPYNLDDDTTIIRVDDNITEISGDNFNQVRDAVFKIERALGTVPFGTLSNVKEFLGISHNDDGTIKSSALTSVGLVTLPIDNSQVGINAGILESKLSLDYSTSDLYSLIDNNITLANALSVSVGNISTDLTKHIGGGPAANLRHVASHIDINEVTSDVRDPAYIWNGLIDKDGVVRSASNVADALLQINDDLVAHQNGTTGTHPASSISIDPINFKEIPATVTDVQSAIEAIDNIEEIGFGIHRATMHSNGVPNFARSFVSDGYGSSVVNTRAVKTYVADFPGTSPIDSVTNGDSVVSFELPATDAEIRKLDSEFSQVSVGDIIRINYGSGFESLFTIESIRFIPGSEWVVRINKNNISNTLTAQARIDRPLFDKEVYHVIASAPSNVVPDVLRGGEFLGSVILADPKSAVAIGNGFDANQIDEDHYNLYLQLYPDGNPANKTISLPAIDITGNAGTTPGKYTLKSIIESTNNSFRAAGYNYRFVAFEYNGNFGIALADSINGASFSIVNGDNTSGTLSEGSFVKNVVGDSTGGIFDALGLGQSSSGYASPAYQSTWTDSTAALIPTKVLSPRSGRFYISDGLQRDYLKSNISGVVFDGYWDAEISLRNQTGSTVEVTYTINEGLQSNNLKKGKTIVVQPAIEYSDSRYKNADYGRFIIKDVVYTPACPGSPCTTLITVVNGIHGTGTAVSSSSGIGLPVKIYFSNDSVGFNLDNIIDDSPTGINFHRLHEILINRNGESFSHERARLKIQSETPSLLDSTNWRIKNVSPKLKGFYDSASQHKYVRFYVLNYNSTTGEFDGYIGRRNPLNYNIYDTGIVSTGKKNLPTRFYDNTGNDYIELEFKDNTVAPGLSISYPKYVDIEIFPSLSTNKEYTLSSTAEINWQPGSGQYIVENVIDRREFGSVSELELTGSAKEYINSGNKYLHANGVIFGFDFVEIDSTDSSLIKFSGGKALVNGVFSSVNDGLVKIPEIKYYSDSNPVTVDWAICVNENNNFESILLTNSKRQFFAINNANPGSSYYVQSATYNELITERKDLTIIAIINVTIASLTINSVKDARKFINQETFNNSLLLSAERSTGSTFLSSDSALAWINGASSSNSTIIVDGYIDVANSFIINPASNENVITIDGKGKGVLRFASGVSMVQEGGNIKYKNIKLMFSNVSPAIKVPTPSGMGPTSNRPKAEFENCEFVFDNCDNGIIIIRDVSFVGCKFYYNQNSTPTSPNIINFASGKGCIIFREISGTENKISNINISGCTFVGTQTETSRYPMILGSLYSNSAININISNNIFNDSVAITNGAAVVIVSSVGTLTGTASSLITGLNISNNICDAGQGIYITSEITSSDSVRWSSGICLVNSIIKGNICRNIGFLVSSNTSIESNIAIENNKCNTIYSCAIDGTYSYDYGDYGIRSPLGNVNISNNNCSYIAVAFTNSQSNGLQSNISILGNKLTASANRIANLIGYSAITVGQLSISDGLDSPINVLINANIINSGYEDGTAHYYEHGIISHQPGCSTITNNIVDGFIINGIESDPLPGTGTIISNNFIYRRGRTITSYIEADGYAFIKDNYFDSTTIDGVNYGTIDSSYTLSNDGYQNLVLYNRNNIVEKTIASCVGENSCRANSASYLYAFAGGGSTNSNSMIGSIDGNESPKSKIFSYADGADGCEFRWRIPLTQIIPFGGRLLSIYIEFQTTADPSAATINDFTIKATTTSSILKTITITAPDQTLRSQTSTFEDVTFISDCDAFAEIIWMYNKNHVNILKITQVTIKYVY